MHSNFLSFSPTSNHLHPLQVENCDSNSRLVVDEDDNGKFRSWREVAEVMNNYYINVAAHIGNKTIKQDGFVDHPSIKAIKNNLAPNSSLAFRHTTEGEITKIIKSLNPKKRLLGQTKFHRN